VVSQVHPCLKQCIYQSTVSSLLNTAHCILELNCILVGSNVSQIFSVQIVDTGSINALKKAIKDECKLALRYVDAESLVLWKVSIAVDSHLTENVGKVDLGENEPLVSVARLYEIFSDQPEDRHLHVIIWSPVLVSLGCNFYHVLPSHL
jgi:hypothetical protein